MTLVDSKRHNFFNVFLATFTRLRAVTNKFEPALVMVRVGALEA